MNTNPDSKVTIRLTKPEDWQTIRDLMLEMLADAPHAFGDTLGEAETRDPLEWQQLIEYLTHAPYGCGYIAEDHQGVCGFVLGNIRHLPPGAANASRLWVAPRQRGRGLGKRLMDSVTCWAEEHGLDQLLVGVRDTNYGVKIFFEGLGFQDTGIREQESNDSSGWLIMLAKVLSKACR